MSGLLASKILLEQTSDSSFKSHSSTIREIMCFGLNSVKDL